MKDQVADNLLWWKDSAFLPVSFSWNASAETHSTLLSLQDHSYGPGGASVSSVCPCWRSTDDREPGELRMHWFPAAVSVADFR